MGVGDTGGDLNDGLGEFERERPWKPGVERRASTGGRMLAERGFASSLRRHLGACQASAAEGRM